MKKIILLIIVSSWFQSQAQYVKSAPWMQNLQNKNIQNPTINQVVDEFNSFWLSHDRKERGSGFNPFMRWENHWQTKVDKQGYQITPQQMWAAFNQKKSAAASRSADVPTSIWQPIGPFSHTNTGSWSNGQGRVNVVYVDPSNENTIYIGTPAGGIWKSTSSGTSWVALSDNLPQIGVSGIAVDPSNSNIIYIATGDCDGSDTYSVGVLKSTDGGLTWNTTGLSFSNTNTFAGDILINPSDSNTILVATSNGIFRSLNAGATWNNVKTGDFSQGRIRFKPNDPTTIYAVSNNRFSKSTNSGGSFTTITTGLPNVSSRLLMDVSAADENVVYILSANSSRNFQGVYKSTDAGVTFVATNTTTNIFESPQSGYDLALAVSQTNANEIYTGCLNIWRSLNGGTTFSKRNNWSAPTSSRYTHADIHYLRFFNNKLYCGSDGGVYVSENAGTLTNFTNLTFGAQISQFYKVAVSNQSASKMVGGLQDNGGHAYSDNQWKNYYGADGMDTAIDPNNSNLFYGFIQFGGNLYTTTNAGNTNAGGIGAPADEVGSNDDGGNWITPLITNSAGDLFAGYSNLYKLTSGAWVRQNTIDLGIGDLNVIAIDPSDDNNMYVSSGSEILKSTDKGVTFNLLYSADNFVSSIDVHTTNSNIVYITTRGTSGEALKSVDGGNTFTSINEGLPSIGKNIIVHQGRNVNNPLFLGTSLGVYYRDDSMTQWEPFDTNLPNVSVSDLDINLEDKKITAATYGRGIWQADIEVASPLNDVKVLEITNPTTLTVDCSSTSIAPSFIIKNSGSTVINAVDITYSFNGLNQNYLWTGTLPGNQSTTVTLPTTNLPADFYTLAINATIVDDEVAQNNAASKTFILNSPGIYNQTNTFETATEKLLAFDASGLFNTWQKGISTSGVINTGTNTVYATNLEGNYADARKAYMYTGCYDFSTISNAEISFKMAYDLELNWDVLYLEYTIDNGLNWYPLGVATPDWYNSDRTPETSGTDCNNCVGGQWTGTNTTLTEYSYSLNNYSGVPNAIFRFVFQSDDSVNAKGIVIDDFAISGTTLSANNFEINQLAIYPNPSKGIFNIATNNLKIDSLDLFDISGKKIEVATNLKNTTNGLQLDLTTVSNGIYFAKITANNQTTIKKIIKN